jgi:hypothetical protein
MCMAAIGIAATSSLAIAQAPPPMSKSEFDALVQDPAVTQSPAVNAAITACGGDRWRVCPAVIPGGGRIVRCLAANADSLSPQCRSAMLKARDTIFVARGAPPPPWATK